MTLDDLAEQVRIVSRDPAAERLAEILSDWKSNDTTVDQLRESVERYIGNAWVEGTQDHEAIYGLWSAFRDNAVAGIGGMTMNERLYWFGLFPRFEECDNDDGRLRIYAKLLASS